jgi:hypothetical protein
MTSKNSCKEPRPLIAEFFNSIDPKQISSRSLADRLLLVVAEIGKVDHTASPMQDIHQPARLVPGRHHSVTMRGIRIPGGIIPLYPGVFVGIRNVQHA